MEPNTGHAPLGAQETPRFDRPVSITLHSQRNRRTDADGTCAKYVIDSLVSAGVLQDDTPKHVPEVPGQTQERITGLQITVVTIAAREIVEK